MRKTALLILFIIVLILVQAHFTGSALALTQTSGDLEVTSDVPLFPPTIIWYPGLSVTKTFTVRNLGSVTHTVSIMVQNTSQTGNIADMYLVKIGSFDQTMKNFWDSGQINLADLTSGNFADYDLTVSLPTTAGNEYQERQAKFDLLIGFAGTTSEVIISGGGTGGGGTSGPAACNDSKPGLPSNFTAVSGPSVGQVTLSWTAPSAPYTYFLVAYSDSQTWPAKWGNPDIGNVNTYTVSGLGSGTYWFWLRAGNGCLPGDFVGPISPGAIAGFSTGTVAEGFVPGVLGVESEEATPSEATNLGEIAGVTLAKPICWWWLILSLAEFGVLSIYYWRLSHRKKVLIKYWWIAAPILAILAFVGDQFMAHRFFTPSRFCNYMWLWVILAASLPTGFHLFGPRPLRGKKKN